MTPLQRYSLYTKLLYVFQRVAILSIAAFVAVSGESLVAVLFLLAYSSTPNHDNVLAQLRKSLRKKPTNAPADHDQAKA